MIKKVMKVHTESVWERYKFSLLMAFTGGMVVGLLIAMWMIKLGSAMM